MSKYEIFNNNPEAQEKRNQKPNQILSLNKIINRKLTNEERCIDHLPKPYYKNSPYQLMEFTDKTKIVCHKNDLSLFLSACKVVFIGDIATGKSSIINRFLNSKFSDEHRPTIGVDFEVDRLTVLGVPYTIQIWDSAGLERFRCIAKSYYRNAQVIVLVFDMTRESTLINTASWLRDALRVNQKNEEPFVFLVGTKSDLLSKKALESMETRAQKVAQEMNAEYFTISSKDGTHVTSLFRRFTSLAFEKSVQALITPKDLNAVKNNIKNLGVFRKEKKKNMLTKWFGGCFKKIEV